LIDVQSKLAEARKAVGHRFRGGLGQAGFAAVSLPQSAQFQPAEDGLYEPAPDFSKFGSGALFPKSEGQVIVIHLVCNIGLYHEEKMIRAEMEIQRLDKTA
jgi:hypothetical protein